MICSIPYEIFTDVQLLGILGVSIFFVIWIVFVPIVITARLEKIIKLLEEKK
ncbi:MAG: hypothetical protein ABIJ41_00580 [Candidatus Omnitrophota bacterium]